MKSADIDVNVVVAGVRAPMGDVRLSVSYVAFYLGY
jgi:hypothetical protein